LPEKTSKGAASSVIATSADSVSPVKPVAAPVWTPDSGWTPVPAAPRSPK
jgi:hypothetical protein